MLQGGGTEPEPGPETLVDVLTYDLFNVAKQSTYQDVEYTSDVTGAKYVGNMTQYKNQAIQLRSSGSTSGIVTTVSGGKASKVEVVWNTQTYAGSARALEVYGSNEPYTGTDASSLYSAATAGTLLGQINYGETPETELTIEGDYEYIGLRSMDSAIYFDEIRITYVK